MSATSSLLLIAALTNPCASGAAAPTSAPSASEPSEVALSSVLEKALRCNAPC
jgi:hypothetical protein